MEVIDFVILSCTVIFAGTIIWEFISLSDALVQYIESVTAKNQELAKLYGVMRDKQALLCWQEEVKIKSKDKNEVKASTPEDDSVKGGDV